VVPETGVVTNVVQRSFSVWNDEDVANFSEEERDMSSVVRR
jgi:hypothetical protein